MDYTDKVDFDLLNEKIHPRKRMRGRRGVLGGGPNVSQIRRDDNPKLYGCYYPSFFRKLENEHYDPSRFGKDGKEFDDGNFDCCGSYIRGMRIYSGPPNACHAWLERLGITMNKKKRWLLLENLKKNGGYYRYGSDGIISPDKIDKLLEPDEDVEAKHEKADRDLDDFLEEKWKMRDFYDKKKNGFHRKDSVYACYYGVTKESADYYKIVRFHKIAKKYTLTLEEGKLRNNFLKLSKRVSRRKKQAKIQAGQDELFEERKHPKKRSKRSRRRRKREIQREKRRRKKMISKEQENEKIRTTLFSNKHIYHFYSEGKMSRKMWSRKTRTEKNVYDDNPLKKKSLKRRKRYKTKKLAKDLSMNPLY